MNNRDHVILPWNESKYLVFSSLCFLVPCIYSYVHALYFYCFVLLATSMISANYWRDATRSYRRDMDHVILLLLPIVQEGAAARYHHRIVRSGHVRLDICVHSIDSVAQTEIQILVSLPPPLPCLRALHAVPHCAPNTYLL